MTSNEVYDGSQNQTNDWVHQLNKLDQSHAGTCTTGRLTCSQFFHELSTNAPGMVRCDLNATSTRSFWQRLSSLTEDVELGGQRCQTVWHCHSPADWERVATSATEERFEAQIVGYSLVVAESQKMMTSSSFISIENNKLFIKCICFFMSFRSV